MQTKNKRISTQTLTFGAVLTALVVILQFLAIFLRGVLPFSLSLVLVPIVIGAAKCGPYMGGWLGLVFGVVVLLSGDAASFYAINPFGTVLTVLVKGFVCGLAAGLVYRLLAKKNNTAAVYTAAAVCPLVNTGVFLLGCVVFFWDTVAEWAAMAGFGDNAVGYVFGVLVGVNFLIEFGLNLVLSPIIIRALKLKV